MKIILRIAAALAIILTLLPFIAIDYWWIRIFDFPHFQLTIFTAVVGVSYLLLLLLRKAKKIDYVILALLVSCFIYQGAKIYPYTPFASHEVLDAQDIDSSKTLSLLTSNVLQENQSTELLLNEIHRYNPDVLLLTETNERWRSEIRDGIKSTYTYSIEYPLDNTYGMLLYSTYELVDPSVTFLVDDSIPSMQSLLILGDLDTIQLYAIHPTPPAPQHNPSSTDRDAEMMKVALASMRNSRPVIVMGDFNDVAWSQSTRLFQAISGLLDIRKGRGFYNTYNADNFILRWPLDHIFVSRHFRAIRAERCADIDSDHFPLYVNLSLDKEGSTEQPKITPSEEQLEHAYEQIKSEKRQD